eukprot:COSAG02_NODE_25749_length_650_cov_0.647913_2_plen_59_part_01
MLCTLRLAAREVPLRLYQRYVQADVASQLRIVESVLGSDGPVAGYQGSALRIAGAGLVV